MTVRGERELQRLAIGTPQLGQLANEIDDPAAQQRFATGNPYLRDSHVREYTRHAKVVGKWEITVECTFVARPAVNTLVVATIRDRDPQVSDRTPEFVGKNSHQSLQTAFSSSTEVW